MNQSFTPLLCLDLCCYHQSLHLQLHFHFHLHFPGINSNIIKLPFSGSGQKGLALFFCSTVNVDQASLSSERGSGVSVKTSLIYCTVALVFNIYNQSWLSVDEYRMFPIRKSYFVYHQLKGTFRCLLFSSPVPLWGPLPHPCAVCAPWEVLMCVCRLRCCISVRQGCLHLSKPLFKPQQDPSYLLI